MNRHKRTSIRIAFLGVFVLTAAFHTAFGQTKADKLNDLIGTYAEYGAFNGSVLIAEKGEIIYKKGFGLANVEWGIPNQPDTKHRLASLTKQFTAMLIVQLASKNKLKLDAPISTYLPDYPKKTGNIITIHQLLTHSSGIPDYTSFTGFIAMMRNPYRPEELVRLFADSALEFRPGEKFQYSNSGYVLLGYIIEKVTGKTYEQVLQNKILTPLKMTNTGYDHNAVIKNKASGYERMGSTFQNAGYLDISVPFSAGGIYSTVEDLYLWDRALYSNKLLPKKYMDLLFKKYIPMRRDMYYGYGWNIGKMHVGSTAEQIQTIGHQGSINGFNTLITRIPSDKSLIVLLNNTGSAPLAEMATGIAGILYNKPYNLPKKSTAHSLAEVIEKDGIKAALLHYKEIRDSGNYALSEFEMNSLGYQLLHAGRVEEAASVFKINVEAFPNSFNAYDSYGEALLLLGDTNRSIENYKQSVKLNPGSENGLKVLKTLGVNSDPLIKKPTIEGLKLLEGEYVVTNPPTDEDKQWKISFKELKGELTANDRGYRYKLVPVGDNQFVNPADGASLVFDTKNKNAITLVLFGRFRFKKLI